MATSEHVAQAIRALQQNFGANFGRNEKDAPGFVAMLTKELETIPDALTQETVNVLLNRDTSRILIGHVRAAIQTAREKIPPDPQRHHEPDTYACPHCLDLGIQTVIIADGNRLYDLIEPCPGYLGRQCPAADETRQQLRPFKDGHGRHAIARLPHHDTDAHKLARTAYRQQQPATG